MSAVRLAHMFEHNFGTAEFLSHESTLRRTLVLSHALYTVVAGSSHCGYNSSVTTGMRYEYQQDQPKG